MSKEPIVACKEAIMVCSVSLQNVHPLAVASANQMWYRMGRFAEKHGLTFVFYAPRRMSIDTARNNAVRMAINGGCSYVFFYDDDMDIDPNTFMRLYNKIKDSDIDAIQASCVIRGNPFDMMFFKRITKEEKQKELDANPGNEIKLTEDGRYLTFFNDYAEYIDKDGLVNVEAMGNAMTLYKTSLFEKVSQPWFKTTVSTEDVFFCCKARDELKDNVRFCVDVTLDTGHILEASVVKPSNVEAFREVAKLYPEIL